MLLTVAEHASGRAALAEALFRIGALRFGKFTLASGKTSSYYLDLRVVPSDPQAYELAIGAYLAMVREMAEQSFDVVAGVATAGIAISSPMAYILKKPMVYVRSEQKRHGLGKLVEGAVRPGWNALVVDDLITDGGSKVVAVETLRKAGCVVKDVMVLVDRLEGGKATLDMVGVKLKSFTDIKDLVGTLYAQEKVTKGDYEAVLRQMGTK
ncbi:MAG: orotate phosphoribosyltransferase [Nitrososphaerota archaeon]|nr:orotate phosphoribosyltransferase [Nitrososphaerota archaeon]